MKMKTKLLKKFSVKGCGAFLKTTLHLSQQTILDIVFILYYIFYDIN